MRWVVNGQFLSRSFFSILRVAYTARVYFGTSVVCTRSRWLRVTICHFAWPLSVRWQLTNDWRLLPSAAINIGDIASKRFRLLRSMLLFCGLFAVCIVLKLQKISTWFLPARRCASAGNSDRNVSVCLSVCPSRAGIVSKRRKLAAWFLHRLVAPRL